MNKYKLFLSSILTMSILSGCGSIDNSQSQIKFESAHSVAVDGVIEKGILLSKQNNERVLTQEISQQLMYTIGQFNGLNGVPDSNKNKISIQSVEPMGNGFNKVTYVAKLFIAYANDINLPDSYELILPARGDNGGLDSFFKKYGNEHSSRNCLDRSAHDVSQGIFWYYYRPATRGCELKNSSSEEEGVVARFPIKLTYSNENTDSKSPEYDKVWEDGKLVVTAIFGMNKEDGGSYDVGVDAFNSMYNKLVRSYGMPVKSNIDIKSGQAPNIDNPELKLEFDTQSGPMEVNLFLIPGIRTVGGEFINKYNELTKTSDYISYNGHAGLGANIRALARMGQFESDQYQIFLVNGCDTFAYVDNSLRDAHHKANPESGPNKYFDLITNAMPAFFTSLSRANFAIIEALVGKTKTYEELLSGFDSYQRANVTGEEDNAFPAPF